MVTKKHVNKLGIDLSLLGFGCMRFPTIDGKIDEVRAEKMLDYAIANGVNYIDTAYPYHMGQSEPFVGKVLKKYDRNSFYLATKLPCWEVKEPDDVMRLFNLQCERLQTDYIDFYLLHSLDLERFNKMVELGAVTTCEKLKAEGRIKYFGFSFHDNYDAFEKIINYRDWDFCQIQLNYMDTDEQAGLKGYELAKAKDIPVIIMEPVKGGLLANLPDAQKTLLYNENDSYSCASWALRYVASFDNNHVVLSGMSDEFQLEDNIKTFTDFEPLSDNQIKLLDNVALIMKSKVYNGCTGCAYCMPCPCGVDIPGSFRLWNRYGIYENIGDAKWHFGNELKEDKRPINCVECGLCEEQCPQKLSIRKDLKRVQLLIDELNV
ncbi:MAG: aldo/keto reductase [Clostridiales bacterium]|nr:aldo/keto reductase [Clostridiales bacterium]